jgi:hypothetical protein
VDFNNFSLPLFTAIFIFTSVSLVSLCKYLFRLVKGTVLQLDLEQAVHTFCEVNIFSFLNITSTGGDVP